MQPLSNLLADFYRRRAGGEQTEQELVLSYWPKVVGPELARCTVPVRLTKNRLVVDVENVTLLNSLKGLGRRIAGRLNAAVGSKVVERIIFRLALPNKLPPRRAATAAGDAALGDEAGGIEDPHLRRIYRVSRHRSQGEPRKRSGGR